MKTAITSSTMLVGAFLLLTLASLTTRAASIAASNITVSTSAQLGDRVLLSSRSTGATRQVALSNLFSSGLTLGGVTRQSWPLESRLQVYPQAYQDGIASRAPVKLFSSVVVSNTYYNCFPTALYNPVTRVVQAYWLNMTGHASFGASVLRAVSTDNGLTWGNANAILTNGGPLSISWRYFAPIRLPDGRLFASAAAWTNTSYRAAAAWSTNDGAAWSYQWLPLPGVGGNEVDISSPPMLTAAGTLLVPFHTWTNSSGTLWVTNGAYRSTDYGQSWTPILWATNSTEVGLRETFDGRLIGFFRHYVGDTNLWRHTSADGGVTWTFTGVVDAGGFGLNAPPAGAVWNIGQKWLLATRDGTQRMALLSSHDEGQTWWRHGVTLETDASFQMAAWCDFGGGTLALVRSQATNFNTGAAIVLCDVYQLTEAKPRQPLPTPFTAYMPGSVQGKAQVDKWLDVGAAGIPLTNGAAATPPMTDWTGAVWCNGTNQALVASSAATNWTFLHDGKPWTLIARLNFFQQGTASDYFFDTCGGATANRGLILFRNLSAGKMVLGWQTMKGAAGQYAINTGAGQPRQCSVPLATNQWLSLGMTFDGNAWRVYLDGQRYQTIYTNGTEGFALSEPLLPLRLGAAASPLTAFAKVGFGGLMVFTNSLSDDHVAAASRADVWGVSPFTSTPPTAWRTALQ